MPSGVCSWCENRRRVWSTKYKGFIRCPKCSPLDYDRKKWAKETLRETAELIKEYWDDPSREEVIAEMILKCRELEVSWPELRDATGKSTEALQRRAGGQLPLDGDEAA